MVKLNARCTVILQNELPPKEKDPGSFILPCAIGTTTVSNALADMGASISIMPFSLFKLMGLGNPKPINMVIEMADRSMQSLKGIIKNVLVKSNKFIFPVDFIILDIIEDDKVPIILGRPMLATAHARIDVFGKKISLEVGTEQIIFDINERESPTIISPICVINNFSVSNEFDEPRDVEEFFLSDDDLGIFSNDNDLLPNLENHDTMFLSPPGSARLNDDSSKMFCNPNNNSSISVDDFVEMDDVWDYLDFRDLTNEVTKFPVKPEFLSSSNRIHLHSPYNLQITCKIRFVNFDPYIEPQSPFNIMSRKAYNSIMKHELVYTGNNMVGFAKNLHVFVGGHQFLIDFIILENINEFVDKWLTEVLFGKPFKEHVGIVDDRVNGVLWFKIRDDKTIFNMPRAEKRFGKLTVRQHNTMGPILKISDEDKSRGIHHPYQKIKGFYQGCLELGDEYKHDQKVIDWIEGHAT
ncbi:homeodomain-like protein [Tanacetum coccineum]